MRVSNGQCATSTLCLPDEPFELLANGFDIDDVIQKNVPPGVGDTVQIGMQYGLTMLGGATIDKEQFVTFGDLLHQPVHGRVITGQQAAHVIIDTDGMRDGTDTFRYGLLKFFAVTWLYINHRGR